ncbi:MAG TPA: DUF1223 domain-containing protein [Pseudomonadales bacterium]|nr:DUF1223 domain-containing protein [Pseudomonadales bacterium]
MMRFLAIFLLTTLVMAARADNAPQVFVSGTRPTTTVELFTSEGCSSCPPADAWLSHFKASRGLWHDVIPLAFHVDYWNDLGWTDKFSDAAFSRRQRQYASTGHIASVYTPGIVVNGREWRQFFNPLRRNQPLPQAPGEPGRLILTRSADTVNLAFKGSGKSGYVAHVVYLGMNLKRHIGRGENAGKVLTEDFVVLDHRARAGTTSWNFSDYAPPRAAAAIAAWISTAGDPAPIQAVAGELAGKPARSVLHKRRSGESPRQ